MKIAVVDSADSTTFEQRNSYRHRTPPIRLQFGDQSLIFSEDEQWPQLSKQLDRSGLAVSLLLKPTEGEHPFLVQQKGRLFQQQYPKVKVLYNRGRFLLVSLDVAMAKRLLADENPHFCLRPIDKSGVIFASRSASRAQPAARAWVQDIIDSLDSTAYFNDLSHLTSYPTRHAYTSSFTNAAHWARSELTAMGYTTALQTFSHSGHTIVNVIAERQGQQQQGRNVVLLVAHLDSLSNSANPNALAPGADDNASGCAGLLRIAWALRAHSAQHDFRLILFGAEEQGLLGSRHYVDQLSTTEKRRISAVINMDMIGVKNSEQATVLLEGGAQSQALIDQLADAAAAYTHLKVETSLNPYASDHLPFIDAGLPAVLTIEGADSANPNIHSSQDTLATLDLSLAMEILRMNTAAIASTLGKRGGITMPNLKLNDLEIVRPDLLELIKNSPLLRFQYSGRYDLNGGVSGGRSALRLDSRATSYKAFNNPIYKLNRPVYLNEDAIRPANGATAWWKKLLKPRATIHIDIDGSHPLNVVSGTVARGLYRVDTPPPHFIGQVTSDTRTNGARHLVVENFRFTWPMSSTTIDRLEIELTGAIFQTPVAEVSFIDSSSSHSYGPYSIEQQSTYFREVEIELDREDGAVDAEPYNTHTHPDRPANLREETLTLASAFRKSGIKITHSSEGNTISTAEAGSNSRWNYPELHDAMEAHWSAFDNRPQWKMWLFLAELADSDSLGGVMFDGNIDEPGGVDRQGTALFTKSPYFHTTSGGYIQANPPEDEAVARELFFNLVHETGHAFNLAHSWQKTQGEEWGAPSWMPVTDDDDALSWMNYPDRPSPGANATWFYERFRFRFNDEENLFLRHAPQHYVKMGDAAWFENHARVTRSSLDRRLSLSVRTQKQVFEYGEPINIELKLKNSSHETVRIHRQLDPSDGLVDIAITAPDGRRTPLIPLTRARTYLNQVYLEPGQAIYQAVNASIGKLGFGFKQPGAYRIEVAYRNIDGSTAAALTQLYVRPAANYADTAIINEMFDARVGRVLYVGGTRMLEDVNDKLDWIATRLGKRHPLQHTLSALRALPMTHRFKTLPAGGDKISVLDEDPEFVERTLKPSIADMASLADTLGHIQSRMIVDLYTDSALKLNMRSEPREAQGRLLTMYRERKVVTDVLQEIELRHNMLKHSQSKPTSQTETPA